MVRPWERFQAWRCGRAWDRYFRTDPIVLLEEREAEANLTLWEEDPSLARELGVAPTFRDRKGRLVVRLEWVPDDEYPFMGRERLVFADGDEELGPRQSEECPTVYHPELWA